MGALRAVTNRHTGRVSTLAIVVIVVLALLLLLFLGGYVGAHRRSRALSGRLRQRIADADRALEAARAQDRGWDRVRLEEAARAAVERERPGFRYDAMHLILVEDRPGTEEDRAQMSAIGDEGEVRVVLVRHGDDWISEAVS